MHTICKVTQKCESHFGKSIFSGFYNNGWSERESEVSINRNVFLDEWDYKCVVISLLVTIKSSNLAVVLTFYILNSS